MQIIFLNPASFLPEPKKHEPIGLQETRVLNEVAREQDLTAKQLATLPSLAEVYYAYIECAKALLKRAQTTENIIAFSPDERTQIQQDCESAYTLHKIMKHKAARLHWNDRVVAKTGAATINYDIYLSKILNFIQPQPSAAPADNPNVETPAEKLVREVPLVRQAAYKEALEELIRYRRSGDFVLHGESSIAPNGDGEPLCKDFMYSSFADFLTSASRRSFRKPQTSEGPTG